MEESLISDRSEKRRREDGAEKAGPSKRPRIEPTLPIQKPDKEEGKGTKRKRDDGDRKGRRKRPKAEPALRVSIPGMVVLNSKPGGGKSHLTRYIMSEYKDRFKYGIAFSRSAFRSTNLDYIPNYDGTPEEKAKFYNFKHMQYSEEVLRELLNMQAAFPDEERPMVFVIFDDDVSDPGMWRTSAIIDAATMYRQFNILLIINTQYVNLIPPVIRECAMQVAVFKTDTERAIKACYESYGQDFNREEEFKHFLFEATKDTVLGQKEHKFIWKDKEMDAPWRVLKAPEKIPHFRIKYGEKKKTTKRKRKGKSESPNKRRKQDMMENFGAYLQELRSMRGDPHEDSIQLPYDTDLMKEMEANGELQ